MDEQERTFIQVEDFHQTSGNSGWAVIFSLIPHTPAAKAFMNSKASPINREKKQQDAKSMLYTSLRTAKKKTKKKHRRATAIVQETFRPRNKVKRTFLLLISVVRQKGSKMKKRRKEKAIEKGDCGLPS